MDSIKQQTLNALSALGYNNIREIEAACINMEATNGKDKILVVPIIEEFTQSTLTKSVRKSYRSG